MVFVMYLRTFFSFLLVYFIFIRVTPAVVPKSDSPNANGDAYAFWNFQICFNSNLKGSLEISRNRGSRREFGGLPKIESLVKGLLECFFNPLNLG
jgi:hypothetical protein